jgi:hypothetical protein
MIKTLLITAILAAPSVKEIAFVEVMPQDHILVIYTDCSAVFAPVSSFTLKGELITGAQNTTIEAPTSDKLVARWKGADKIDHEVITDCATLKQIDCVIQHAKMVQLMLKAFPKPE